MLRRILRRAVRYGRRLGFTQPFLAELVDTLVESFGQVFPELAARGKASLNNLRDQILTLRLEQESIKACTADSCLLYTSFFES